MNQEEERKYDVDASFRMPDLPGMRKLPAKTLTATYYDTEDLRLARSGATFRRRNGEWTIKLPTANSEVRDEISSKDELLLVPLTRGVPLRKVAKLTSRRTVYELPGLEIVDDQVTVHDGQSFREVEVELKGGKFSTVEKKLLAAGARISDFTPKLVRALGPKAKEPPDLVAPGTAKDSAGDVVTQAVRRAVARIFQHHSGVCLKTRLSDGDTPTHQMRVGCRRLRSDLRTFASLVDKGWGRTLRDELGWLAGLLGAARDLEVLRLRLDNASPAIDAALAQRQDAALSVLDSAMRTDRYAELMELLTLATRKPKLTRAASRRVDQQLFAQPWRALQEAVANHEDWHRVRILTKRARYAVEAVEPKSPFAKALAALQDVLGEHQDAMVAAQVWQELSEEDPFTAGRLYERELARAAAARAGIPEAWARCERTR